MQGRRKPFFRKIGFLLPCTPPSSKKLLEKERKTYLFIFLT